MSIEIAMLTVITILEFIAFGLIAYEVKRNKKQQTDKELEWMKKIEDIEESIDFLAGAIATLIERVQKDFVPAGDLLQGIKR
tara:strand:- start:516 stop:761 length:246 start_codon:yes stop_codon:yes gene_type:complete